MINRTLVRQAFRKVLVAIAGLPPKERRAWENRSFTPPTDKSWLRETLMIVNERLSATNQLQLDAIMQYDVIVPGNTGTEEADELALLVANAFKPATSMNDPVEVAIDRCEQLSGREFSESGGPAGVWWQVPVQITFRSYAVNT